MATDDCFHVFLTKPQTEETLTELQSKVSLVSVFRELSLPETSTARTELLLTIVKRCLQSSKVTISLLEKPEMQTVWKNIAKSKHVVVRRMLVEFLFTLVKSIEGKLRLDAIPQDCLEEVGIWNAVKATTLVDCLTNLVLDAECGIAETAAKSLVVGVSVDTLAADKKPKISRSGQTPAKDVLLCQKLSQNTVVSPLSVALNDPATPHESQIRILDLAIQLGKMSDSVFDFFNNKSFYQKAVDLYQSDDILLKLNAIELINGLCCYPKGRTFVLSSSITHTVISDLEDPIVDDVSRLGILHFVAELLKEIKDKTFLTTLLKEKNGALLNHTWDFLCCADDSSKIVGGMQVWSSLLSVNSSTTAFVISKYPKMAAKVADLMLHSSDQEICKAALSSWTRVLACDIDIEGENPKCEHFEDLVKLKVLPNSLKVLQKPFSELRPHAYALSTVLTANLDFAFQSFFTSDFHLKLIKNQQSDTTYEAKLAKYDFVKTVTGRNLAKPSFKSILSQSDQSFLCAYSKGGPFYVFADTAGTKVEDLAG